MTGWLAALALILLAGGVFAAATSVVLSLAWPLVAGALRRLPPRSRARAARAVAVAPALVPLALVAICLAPGLSDVIGWHADHCLAHADHPHLCLVHRAAALSAPLVALLGASGLAALAALARLRARLSRARARQRALRQTSAGALAPGVALVSSARPFSLAAGLLRPQIWVSTALVDALPSDQLAVVIEHERGHVGSRDSLWRLVAAACALPLWPSVRHALLAELALASEQACDEAAGARIGDRLCVAETILAVERLVGSASVGEPTGVLAFGGSTVPERVHSLLETPPAPLPARYVWAGAAALTAAASLGAGVLHHATEHLVRILLHGS